MTAVATSSGLSANGRATTEPAPGRNRISARALASLAVAVAASAAGVPASRVRAEVTDASGLLGVSIRTPVVVPPLLSAAGGDGGTVLERAEQARGRIAERFEELSGCRVGRVVVHVTGAITREEGRVR